MAMTVRDLLEQLHVRDSLDPEQHPHEQNTGVVVLLDQDKLLARLVAIWPNVPVGRLNLDAECPAETPETHRTRWLWSQLDPDPFPRWLQMAGLPANAPHLIEKCWVAAENQMVFPDGTLARWARQYVTRKVRGVLG